MTFDTGEFIRRLLIYVLPDGFHRIRCCPLPRQLSSCSEARALPGADRHGPPHRRSFNDWDDPAHHGKLKAAHGNITRALSRRQAAINQSENCSTPVAPHWGRRQSRKTLKYYQGIPQRVTPIATILTWHLLSRSRCQPNPRLNQCSQVRCDRLAAYAGWPIDRSRARCPASSSGSPRPAGFPASGRAPLRSLVHGRGRRARPRVDAQTLDALCQKSAARLAHRHGMHVEQRATALFSGRQRKSERSARVGPMPARSRP